MLMALHLAALEWREHQDPHVVHVCERPSASTSAGLLTVTEVADRLGVHETTVRRRVRDGGLAARRIGRQLMIAEEAVQ